MYIAETNSTNDLLRQHPELLTIRTDYQTAGRGQQGNGWESERSKNLLFSTLLLRPAVPLEQQFLISMAVALALREAVAEVIGDRDDLCIKWPNDLYVGDKKVAGILIENTLAAGAIDRSIIGVGLNVNQEQWVGSAPNPTSIKLLTGHDEEVEPILHSFLKHLSEQMLSIAALPEQYRAHLYRRQGWYWWEEREVSLTPTMNQNERTDRSFEAKVIGVTEQGELQLQTRGGENKTYHFKQIRYII